MNKNTLERIGHLLPLAIAAVALVVQGCASYAAGTAIAAGEQATGDAYANSKLAKVDGTSAGTAAQKQAVADLTRVSTDLNALAAGSLSFTELGAVQAQLKVDGVAFSGNSEAATDITSIANIFSKTLTGPNGTVLPAQSIAIGTIKNITSGVAISVATAEGGWSVTNPGVWPAPTSTSP